MLESNNEWEWQKNSVAKVWSYLASKFSSILSPRGEDSPGVILPASVRYALRYRDTNLQPEDWVSLLEEKYGFLWVYICLKFYEKDPEKLRQHLQEIIQGIKSRKKFEEYTKKLKSDILILPKDSTILWTKSAQVSRNGFSEFCEGISRVFNSHKKEWIPILVAFSGLLGLKWIVENMWPDDVFYIFFPKNSPEEAFLSIKYVDNQVHISCLADHEIEIIFHDKNIIMVDDTQKTGATFDKAERKIKQYCQPRTISKKALVTVQKNWI